MVSKTHPIYPSEAKILKSLGERLALARKRRRLKTEVVAARSAISRMTLYRAEQGDSTVSLGVYLRILAVLGLQGDLDLIAANDVIGQKIQDSRLSRGSKS